MEDLAVQEGVIHKSLVGHIVSKMKHSVVELLEVQGVQELHLRQDIILQRCVTELPTVGGPIVVVNADSMERLGRLLKKQENMLDSVRLILINVGRDNLEA